VHSIFREFNRTQSLRYAQLRNRADSSIRSCELVAFYVVNFVSGQKTLDVQMDDFGG